ncbi:hypothetical protein F4604DRAFT_1680058 [Suillus subluteus]|nr:hypothetical protein F4604DRAFT_1680058 [Suillus subluteus]
MAGTAWTTPEQKEFLETYYSGFLLAQLQAKVSQYWDPIYLEWFKRWPEQNVGIENTLAGDPHAGGDKNTILREALQKRRQQIRTWFNYRSQRSGRSAVNSMTKVIQKTLTNKAKGTRVHTPAEIFSTIAYKEEVQEQVQDAIKSGELVTKQEKLSAVHKLTREAYKAASPEVKALCEEKVQEERNAKVACNVQDEKLTPTNKQYAMALQECTTPIAQFLQVIKDMTGWEWTVIGAGPDPDLGGQLNAMSYHTGVNGDGLNWKQATPKFIERHLNPYLEFVGMLIPEHVRKSRAIDFVAPIANHILPMTSSPSDEGFSSLEGASSTPASETALYAPLTLSGALSQVQVILSFNKTLLSTGHALDDLSAGLTFNDEMITDFSTDISLSLNPYDDSVTSTPASNFDFDLPGYSLSSGATTPVSTSMGDSLPDLSLSSGLMPDTPITSWRKDMYIQPAFATPPRLRFRTTPTTATSSPSYAPFPTLLEVKPDFHSSTYSPNPPVFVFPAARAALDLEPPVVSSSVGDLDSSPPSTFEISQVLEQPALTVSSASDFDSVGDLESAQPALMVSSASDSDGVGDLEPAPAPSTVEVAQVLEPPVLLSSLSSASGSTDRQIALHNDHALARGHCVTSVNDAVIPAASIRKTKGRERLCDASAVEFVK